MKIAQRLMLYTGVALATLGLLLIPANRITAGITIGAISYLPLSIFIWLVHGVIFGRVSKEIKGARSYIDGNKIGLALVFLGLGAGLAGAITRNVEVIQVGTFLLLVGIEFCATKDEWISSKV